MPKPPAPKQVRHCSLLGRDSIADTLGPLNKEERYNTPYNEYLRKTGVNTT